LKFASLNEKLLKVRDKYGVDVVKYASEYSYPDFRIFFKQTP
jgi:hypothetical protein